MAKFLAAPANPRPALDPWFEAEKAGLGQKTWHVQNGIPSSKGFTGNAAITPGLQLVNKHPSPIPCRVLGGAP